MSLTKFVIKHEGLSVITNVVILRLGHEFRYLNG